MPADHRLQLENFLAYTIAIGHKEGNTCIIDVVRGTSGKFDPQEVTKEYAALCRDYRAGRADFPLPVLHGRASLAVV